MRIVRRSGTGRPLRATVATVALVLAVASCGRYGKPVRPEPAPEPPDHAQSLQKR